MLFFLKARLVVFATPKTASTALDAALAPHADIILRGDPAIKHCTFHRYKWRFEKFLLIYTKTPPRTCALIRHPEDWLRSWYRFRHGDWLDKTPRSTKGLSFDQFVEGYLAETPPPFAQVGSQARFLTHPKADQRVDDLFRYDALQAFERYIAAQTGVEMALERKNASMRADAALSPALRQRLEVFCADDYALYEQAYH